MNIESHLPYVLGPMSLYVHIPFCRCKCLYCDFYSVTGYDEEAQNRYIDVLLEEMLCSFEFLETSEVPSIYIGGGTPSMLTPAQLEHLLGGMNRILGSRKPREWSFEMNPVDATPEKLSVLRDMGVNRVSLGVQSFSKMTRCSMGRHNKAGDPLTALKSLRELWDGRLSADLIYGVPGQSVAEAIEDLGLLVEADFGHISWYQLALEEGTPLTKQFEKGNIKLPNDDDIAEMLDEGRALLESKGYHRYEVSAWAKEGEESIHNMTYWSFGNWLGIGPSGASQFLLPQGSLRIYHPEDMTGYLETNNPSVREETVTGTDLLVDFFLMGLRTTRGVDQKVLSRYYPGIETSLESFMQEWAKFVVLEDGYYRMTRDGMEFTDLILRNLMEYLEELPQLSTEGWTLA